MSNLKEKTASLANRASTVKEMAFTKFVVLPNLKGFIKDQVAGGATTFQFVKSKERLITDESVLEKYELKGQRVRGTFLEFHALDRDKRIVGTFSILMHKKS